MNGCIRQNAALVALLVALTGACTNGQTSRTAVVPGAASAARSVAALPARVWTAQGRVPLGGLIRDGDPSAAVSWVFVSPNDTDAVFVASVLDVRLRAKGFRVTLGPRGGVVTAMVKSDQALREAFSQILRAFETPVAQGGEEYRWFDAQSKLRIVEARDSSQSALLSCVGGHSRVGDNQRGPSVDAMKVALENSALGIAGPSWSQTAIVANQTALAPASATQGGRPTSVDTAKTEVVLRPSPDLVGDQVRVSFGFSTTSAGAAIDLATQEGRAGEGANSPALALQNPKNIATSQSSEASCLGLQFERFSLDERDFVNVLSAGYEGWQSRVLGAAGEQNELAAIAGQSRVEDVSRAFGWWLLAGKQAAFSASGMVVEVAPSRFLSRYSATESSALQQTASTIAAKVTELSRRRQGLAVELKAKVETGQPAFVALLATTCPVVEGVHELGSTKAALRLGVSAVSAPRGVDVAPWVTEFGAGVWVRINSSAGDVRWRATEAAKLAVAAFSSISFDDSDIWASNRPRQDERRSLLEGVAKLASPSAPGLVLFGCCGDNSPGVAQGQRARDRLSTLIRSPLRLAVLADASAEQTKLTLDELRRRLPVDSTAGCVQTPRWWGPTVRKTWVENDRSALVWHVDLSGETRGYGPLLLALANHPTNGLAKKLGNDVVVKVSLTAQGPTGALVVELGAMQRSALAKAERDSIEWFNALAKGEIQAGLFEPLWQQIVADERSQAQWAERRIEALWLGYEPLPERFLDSAFTTWAGANLKEPVLVVTPEPVSGSVAEVNFSGAMPVGASRSALE